MELLIICFKSELPDSTVTPKNWEWWHQGVATPRNEPSISRRTSAWSSQRCGRFAPTKEGKRLSRTTPLTCTINIRGITSAVWCLVCLFVWCLRFFSCLDAEASLAPSPVNWLVGQFVSCFQMSTLSVSLDSYRASIDHGIQETILGKS